MEDGPSKGKASAQLQDWLFSQYKVLNAKGERRDIKSIFADSGLIAPGGTGECAAPKLLQYAYAHGMHPVAMGEFWYGLPKEARSDSRDGSTRHVRGNAGRC